MRLRQTPWPMLVLLTVLSVGYGLVIIAADSGLHGSPVDVFVGPALVPLAVALIGWRRDDVQLRPEGLQRGERREPFLVPWARIQAVALAGDTAGVCPTLWTDDGREIGLNELGKSLGVGERRVQRNCERIRSHWEEHRGLSWQPAPWVAEVVPGWVAGSSRFPDGISPAAISARLRPAWWLWITYVVAFVAPIAYALLRGWEVAVLFVLVAVVAIGGFWGGRGRDCPLTVWPPGVAPSSGWAGRMSRQSS